MNFYEGDLDLEDIFGKNFAYYTIFHMMWMDEEVGLWPQSLYISVKSI